MLLLALVWFILGFSWLSAIFATLTLAVLMLSYLGSDVSVEKDIADIISLRTAVTKRLYAQQQFLERIQSESVGLTVANRIEVVNKLANDASKKVLEDFESSLADKYGFASNVLKTTEVLQSHVANTTDRLEGEIRALLRRGNLNLVLGAIATTFAIVILAYTAVFTTINQSDLGRSLQAYLLRVSIVVFIQLFGFFFLRLYRDSLSDIKYFQNEITNIQQQWLAMKYAILNNSLEIAAQVVESLAKTERNFVIKRGESTIDLERLKLENLDFKSIAANLRDIAKGNAK